MSHQSSMMGITALDDSSLPALAGLAIAPGSSLLGGGAFQNGNFGSLIELIEMLGLPAGIEVDVGVIARGAGGLYRSALLLLGQFLKSVVNLLRNQRALLYPAFRAACGAYSGKAAFALEYLNAIAVLYRAGLAENRGDMVTKNCLRRGDVRDLLYPASPMAATETAGAPARAGGTGSPTGFHRDHKTI